MFRITSVPFVVLVFLGAMALSPSQAVAAAPLPTHVACVGDSITAGLFASSPAASYPSVMQNLFGSAVNVQNFGHSGATMMTVADLPYQNQVEYTNATTFVAGAGASAVIDVVIMLGTNDSKSYNWMVGTGTRAQQFVTDCGALVDHFASQSTHPRVYLALPPRAFDNTYGISGAIIHDQMLPLLRQVAAAKGIPVIDVDTPTAPHRELFPDGVHPNDVGYALVAQVIHDGLLSAAPPADAGAGGQGGASGAGGAVVDASADAARAAGGATGGGTGGQGAGGSVAGTGGAPAGAGGAGGSVAGIGGSSAGGSGAGGSGGAVTSGGSSSGCGCTLAGDRGASTGAGLLLVTIAWLALRARARRRR